MTNKQLILTLFAVMFLVAFSNATQAFSIRSIGGVAANYSIIGGTSTGSTANIIFSVQKSPGNVTLRLLTNQTAVSTWTAITMTGTATNTTCAANGTCYRSGSSGDVSAVFTLPSDCYTSTSKRCAIITELNGTSNATQFISIDQTAPTFTLYPSEGFLLRSQNKTVNVTVVTNENVSSIWIFATGIGKNFSKTLDVNGANGLSNSADRTWSFSTQLTSDQLVSYYARAYDYAMDGGNGATSSVRTFNLNSGLSSGGKFQVNEQAVTSNKQRTILIIGGIALLAYLLSRR